MFGQQTRRPHFVRIAQILGLATGQIGHERARLVGDGRRAAWPRTVVESLLDAEGRARRRHPRLDCLMAVTSDGRAPPQ